MELAIPITSINQDGVSYKVLYNIGLLEAILRCMDEYYLNLQVSATSVSPEYRVYHVTMSWKDPLHHV